METQGQWWRTGTGKLVRAAMNTILVVAILEGGSWLAIRILSSRLPIRRTSEIFREQSAGIRQLLDAGPTTLIVIDSVLGWRYRPGHHPPLYTISAQGVRGTRTLLTGG